MGLVGCYSPSSCHSVTRLPELQINVLAATAFEAQLGNREGEDNPSS